MVAGRKLPLPEPDTFRLEDFKSLHLSVPLESTKYAFISMFLRRVLNLRSHMLIQETADLKAQISSRAKHPVEILPQVTVPSDLWLVHDIVIRNISVKTTILHEVNTLLLLYVDSLQTNELFLIDEFLLLSLEKRINDQNLGDFNNKQDPEPYFNSLNEEEEYEENADEDESVFLRRTVTGVSDLILSRATSLPLSTTSSKNGNRLSNFSRELVANKRKFSFLSLPPLPVATEEKQLLQSTKPVQTLPELNALTQLSPGQKDTFSAHSIANGLLSKSRIYNKMKKRRELANLVASAPNSITSASSDPLSRGKSNPHELDAKISFNTAFQLSAAHRAENQRRKHEYYLQTKILGELTQILVGFFGKSGLRANLIRLMEFIKDSVFKFILVDICHMLVEYGHHKIQSGTSR